MKGISNLSQKREQNYTDGNKYYYVTIGCNNLRGVLGVKNNSKNFGNDLFTYKYSAY